MIDRPPAPPRSSYTHPGNTPGWILKREALPPRQAQTLELIERYHAASGEPCPVTYVAKSLGLHHETVRECVSTLFERGFVVGPGSPVTPSTPMARPLDRGWHYVVYFLLDTKRQLVKIGRTQNLDQRIATLRRGRGDFVMLIGSVDVDAMGERDWHRRFSQSRVSGEWFALTPAFRAELAARFGVQFTQKDGAPSI